jgi:hypothetical protein
MVNANEMTVLLVSRDLFVRTRIVPPGRGGKIDVIKNCNNDLVGKVDPRSPPSAIDTSSDCHLSRTLSLHSQSIY